MCGTDGERVLLPSVMTVVSGEADALARYRLLAVQQAARLFRRTPHVFESIREPATRNWFMLAEAAIVDYWIAAEAPGLVEGVRQARVEALAARSVPGRSKPGNMPLEREVQRLLAAPPHVLTIDVQAEASSEACLLWAQAAARQHASSGQPSNVTAVPYWGTVVRPSTFHAALLNDGDGQKMQPAARPVRVSEMRRRPQPREANPDEDDADSGSWVIRADDPQESVEDPMGLQRPADRDEQADPGGLADSLSELPEARVVRTREQATEVLRSEDAPRRRTMLDSVVVQKPGVSYPEWDARIAQYRQHAVIVREPAPTMGDAGWVTAVTSRRARLIRLVRTRFERLRPRPVRVYGRTDGVEVDVGAYVTACADLRAGVSPEGRLYVATRFERRELAVAVLVDTSASTDAWVSGDRRIIDVEKEAMLVVCEALDALGDRYALFALSGEGADHVRVVSLKRFEEPSTMEIRRRIAGLDCDGYTRLGASIRHVTAALCRQPARVRLLLLLSDGKPNDVDVYEGRYGVEDTRQAVAEARRQGLGMFCVTIDREAPRYGPRIFGRSGFAVLRHAEQLPTVVVEILRQLIRA
jgi:nitric oxide reductase NorD protein